MRRNTVMAWVTVTAEVHSITIKRTSTSTKEDVTSEWFRIVGVEYC